jgi:hypothetical protein
MNINTINYILIVLIFFIFYICNCFWSRIKIRSKCNNYKLYKKILYSNLQKELKSGDLLFYDHNLTSVPIRTFSHRQFSHIGIIIKINGILYSYEMDTDDLKYDMFNNKYNVKLSPLNKRLSNYCGDIFISSLKQPLSKEKEQYFISSINKKRYKFLSNFKLCLAFLSNSNYIYENEKICTEFVAEILDDLEITDNISSSKKPELTNNIINLSNGSIYHNPIHIIMDELIIKSLDFTDYKYYNQ